MMNKCEIENDIILTQSIISYWGTDKLVPFIDQLLISESNLTYSYQAFQELTFLQQMTTNHFPLIAQPKKYYNG